MTTPVTVLDYGVGNLLSVRRGFEYCGADVHMTSAVEDIARADRLVLPGVGAFADGMEGLKRRGLIDPIIEFVKSGRPFLGICLGMQMMMDSSDEFGSHQGLGLIQGQVRPIRSIGEPAPHKVPHIGWNELVPSPGAQWEDTLLDGISPGSAVYFVHSFTPVPTQAEHWLADTRYDGHRMSAVIRNGAAYGCQFHPEKSGTVGLAILANFLTLKRSTTEASCVSSV